MSSDTYLFAFRPPERLRGLDSFGPIMGYESHHMQREPWIGLNQDQHTIWFPKSCLAGFIEQLKGIK